MHTQTQIPQAIFYGRHSKFNISNTHFITVVPDDKFKEYIILSLHKQIPDSSFAKQCYQISASVLIQKGLFRVREGGVLHFYLLQGNIMLVEHRETAESSTVLWTCSFVLSPSDLQNSSFQNLTNELLPA